MNKISETKRLLKVYISNFKQPFLLTILYSFFHFSIMVILLFSFIVLFIGIVFKLYTSSLSVTGFTNLRLYFSLIIFSISRAISGFSFRYNLEFSLP